MIHYDIIELDLPEVTGTCTINGNPGFGTPLTCTDQDNPTTATRTHKFTNSTLVLAESGVYKCVNNISETTPKLKTGSGVGSRATCTITLNDFIGDPNRSSPALVASPALAKQGTFFGKLKSRNIVKNKAVRRKFYQYENGVHTLVKTHYYIVTSLKSNGGGVWVLSCQDVLHRASDENSQFPRLVTGTLTTDITETLTSFVIDGDIADWTPYSDFTAVIGTDLLMITNATGDASQVTLTVARPTTINIGSRTILNTPEAHSAGDEVFRARKFVNANLYDVIEKVFEDAGIESTYYDSAQITSELNTWLSSINGSIDAIFYESVGSTAALDSICKTFLFDIWTDITTNKITLKAASPWESTTAILTEGKEINYGSIKVDEPEDLFYSRAFLQYDKRKLTSSNDDVNFTRSSLAFNDSYEGEIFYDEEKVKKIEKSIILSNRLNNIEVADLTTVRFAQRFSNRPQIITGLVEEKFLNFSLGDVVEIVTKENQSFDGAAKVGVRAQVTHVYPKNGEVGRQYQLTAVTYNPYAGGISSADINIHSQYDVNLYTAAGGPVASDTFTFIISNDVGQNELNQAIATGSMPSGSTINIVLLNGAVLMGKGGRGGDSNATGTLDGEDGGNTLVSVAGITINVYLNGTTPDFGNGTYEADGYLYAPGGGGGAARDTQGGSSTRIPGGGARGNTPGRAGTGASVQPPSGSITYPQDGTKTSFGSGGSAIAEGSMSISGFGGAPGNDGADAVNGDSMGAGGLAGKAIITNGSTLNVITNGETSRFVKGRGDDPTSLT